MALASNERMLGSYPGVLDRMGAGIAELGQGNAVSSRLDITPASYWNPAILGFLGKKPVLSMGADMRSLNRNGGYASIEWKVAPNMGCGLSLVNRGDYNFEAYDENEELLGTARPQDLGFYLGMGIKTSRRNSLGASLQWFQANRDIGGVGDINTIGIWNVSWFRKWNNNWQSGLVIRNLGMNKRLSASYEYRSFIGGNAAQLDGTAEDFFPKTMVASVRYTTKLAERELSLAFEFLDFQLDPEFFDMDADHHAQGIRLGAEYQFKSDMQLRAGFDRGNISFGFGYLLPYFKRKKISFDYAVLLERYATTINILLFGLKYHI